MAGHCSVPEMPRVPTPWLVRLHILEHAVSVGDATIYYVLRKLLRGPLPVVKGHQKTFVEGPVDYTDLRTEFIGLIYEGLLDYRLKRTDEQTGPQVFLNLGREPVLPLARLRDMLENDRKGLKDLLTTLRKEKVTASVASEEEETEEEAEEQDEAEEESDRRGRGRAGSRRRRNPTHRRLPGCRGGGQAVGQGSGRPGWAGRQAGEEGIRQRIPDPHRGRSDQAHQPGGRPRRVLSGAGGQHPQGHRHVLHPAPTGRADRPSHLGAALLRQVPSHRERAVRVATIGTLIPKTPEEILGLKVCDPACGSASFLVAALHYLTEALYKSLCHHRKLDDPEPGEADHAALRSSQEWQRG